MDKRQETEYYFDENTDLRKELPSRVSGVLEVAVTENASDIHIDPVGAAGYRLCQRVDGMIHSKENVSESDGRHLINQIKVAARLTPDHIFGPVESRMMYGAPGEHREVRVTIMPTTRGEAAHLRLLTPPREIIEPQKLGISKQVLNHITRVFKSSEGLILISGPTGAGKTMTLYSLISFLDLESKIAISIEDPVEYDLAYVRQIQADDEHGLSMCQGLRSALRMDPDVMIVGEIRDAQSAITAVRAAASGRFVLATMHAGDAATAIETYRNYSVPRHLLSSTLRMISSQNLLRRVCGVCAQSRKITSDEKEMFKAAELDVPGHVPKAVGCDECHGYGYKGRTGVFEIVPVGRDLNEAIAEGRSANFIRDMIGTSDVPSLLADSLAKVADGSTTMEEIRSFDSVIDRAQ